MFQYHKRLTYFSFVHFVTACYNFDGIPHNIIIQHNNIKLAHKQHLFYLVKLLPCNFYIATWLRLDFWPLNYRISPTLAHKFLNVRFPFLKQLIFFFPVLHISSLSVTIWTVYVIWPHVHVFNKEK